MTPRGAGPKPGAPTRQRSAGRSGARTVSEEVPAPLGARLEALYARHHRVENLHPDPLVFPRRYRDPADGEVAGLVAAGFAYGHVDQIMLALEQVFHVLGPSPASFVRTTPPRELPRGFAGFGYRFHKAGDLALLLHLVGQALDLHGSLRECFRAGDPGGAIGPALSAFCEAILSGDPRPILRVKRVPGDHPVRHLLASPARGGAAKRMCLFLRWMIRRDVLDPGFWHGAVDPSRLIVPLDTHVARVGRELGLTTRKTADWKAACEITDSLRRHDPADPVRYDFSLFRFGMGRARRP